MKRLIFVLLAMSGLAACSAEVSGGGGGDTAAANTTAFPHQITGPIVEGTWTSDCLLDSFKSGYKIMKVEFKGQSFNRSANLYSDKSCTVALKKTEDHGIFRWAQATSYGGYQADYKIDLGGGWTSNTSEEILIENGVMYLSDFRIGFGRIDKSFPMKSSSTGTTNPKPTPAPSPAPPAQASCPKFSGIYYGGGAYTSLSQNQCKELSWQALYSDLTPKGRADVYLMDKLPHSYEGTVITSYYQDSSFILEVQKSGGSNLILNFSIESTYEACGVHFGGVKTVLVRKGTINNIEDYAYCAYWEKYR